MVDAAPGRAGINLIEQPPTMYSQGESEENGRARPSPGPPRRDIVVATRRACQWATSATTRAARAAAGRPGWTNKPAPGWGVDHWSIVYQDPPVGPAHQATRETLFRFDRPCSAGGKDPAIRLLDVSRVPHSCRPSGGRPWKNNLKRLRQPEKAQAYFNPARRDRRDPRPARGPEGSTDSGVLVWSRWPFGLAGPGRDPRGPGEITTSVGIHAANRLRTTAPPAKPGPGFGWPSEQLAKGSRRTQADLDHDPRLGLGFRSRAHRRDQRRSSAPAQNGGHRALSSSLRRQPWLSPPDVARRQFDAIGRLPASISPRHEKVRTHHPPA